MLKLGEDAVCISGNEELIAKYFVVNFVHLIFTFRQDNSSFTCHPSYLVMLITYVYYIIFFGK